MANRGGNRHLKRIAAGYKEKKEYKYLLKPDPGPHSLEESLPLAGVLRDYLNVASNLKETKYILRNNLVKVDERIVSIHNVGKYIVLYDDKGNFVFKNFDTSNKLLKVINKLKVKGGKIQYTFHDGRTYLGDNSIKVGDSVIFDLINKKLVKVIPQSLNSKVLIIKGKHKGKIGILKNVEVLKNDKIAVVDTGESIKTSYKYLLFVGDYI
jgi:small subunit ribosomal protein S4e